MLYYYDRYGIEYDMPYEGTPLSDVESGDENDEDVEGEDETVPQTLSTMEAGTEVSGATEPFEPVQEHGKFKV
jgi:hypothetical protein